MQYLYLVGVGIIVFFAFMFLTEQFLLKRSARPAAPALPTPPPKPPDVSAPRSKEKRKKGRRR